MKKQHVWMIESRVTFTDREGNRIAYEWGPVGAAHFTRQSGRERLRYLKRTELIPYRLTKYEAVKEPMDWTP